MATFIVILGPPGAGKGTQAQSLSDRLGLPHISSGDIFRENLRIQSEMGKVAKSYMEQGELVPDEVAITMIRERLSCPECHSGAILDGFPRTPAQAEALVEILGHFEEQVNAVSYIRVPESVLIERLIGRWTCRAQGHIFHEKFTPPKEPGQCDYDGSELFQRDDDKVETVARRIRVYLEQTMPLIQYYQQHGVLVEVDGTKEIVQVGADLLAALAIKG